MLLKITKAVLIFIVAVIGLIIIAACLINTPFAHRFITGKVNSIFSRADIPITVNHINKILPGSITVNGVLLIGKEGDTIIYSEKVKASFVAGSLLHKKVLIPSVSLHNSELNLFRGNQNSKINIADAFSKPDKPKKQNRKEGRWEVSVGRAEITDMNFIMNDSVSKINISQKISFLEFETERMSITDKVIILQTLNLKDATGFIRMGIRPENEEIADDSSWTFGLKNASLRNINETYDDSGDTIIIKLSIEEGTIKARNADIKGKEIDLSRVSLTGVAAELGVRVVTEKPAKAEPFNLTTFPWDIKGSDIDLKDISFKVGEYVNVVNQTDTSQSAISNLNLKLSDLALNSSALVVRMKDLSVDLNNGFSIKEMNGAIDSKAGLTSFNLSIETGYSNVNINGECDCSLFDILSKPESISNGKISITRTSISLKDLILFKPDLSQKPLIGTLSSEPVKVEGKVFLEGAVLRIPDFSVSQLPNIGLTINGDIKNGMDIEKTTGNLQFKIAEVNPAWAMKLLEEAGIKTGIGSFSELSIEGVISDSLLAPRLQVKMESDLGDVDLDGTFNLADTSYVLNSAFHHVQVDKILNNSSLGSFTGKAEITGSGIRPETLIAKAVVSIDSLHLNGYEYTNAKIVSGINLPDIDIRFLIDDPSVNLNLTAHIIASDSLTSMKSTGTFHGKLNEIYLIKDTVSAEGVIDVYFTKRNSLIDARLAIADMVFVTPSEKIRVAKLESSFKSDSSQTSLSGSSDFITFDIDIKKPVSEIKGLMAGYRSYVNSFTEPELYNPDTRVGYLPEIRSNIKLKSHEAVGIFIKNFYFSSIDASINNYPSEGRLEYIINGSDLKLNDVVVGTLNNQITDSEGIMNLTMNAEKCTIFSQSLSKISLTSKMGGWKGLTNLSVFSGQNEPMYELELGSMIDSNLIFITVPSKKLILNGVDWVLDSDELLTINSDGNKFMPTLKMHTGDSYMYLTSGEQVGKIQIKGDFGNVDINSLLPPNLVKGNPGGNISGSAQLGIFMDGSRDISTDLNISDVRWSDMSINNLDIDGQFKTDSAKNFTLNLVTKLDSSEVIIDAQKPAGGTRSIEADIKKLPLKATEPFVSKILSDLQGSLSGSIKVSSNNADEQFNGEIFVRDGGMRIIPLNSMYTIPDERIVLKDKKIVLDNFTILDSLGHKLIVEGSFDFGRPEAVTADLQVSSADLQIMNIDPDEGEGFSGVVFVDSKLSASGLLSDLALKGKIVLTKGTEVFYSRKEDLSLSESEQIITFISDTSLIGHTGSPSKVMKASRGGISVATEVDIDPGTKVHFNLSQKLYDISLMIQGGGSLNYNMLENNQMNLSGKYEIGQGTADVKMIGWPNKAFLISPGGFIQWDGNIEDPNLQFEAINRVRTSYTNPVDGKLRDVDFNVILKLTDRLSELDLVFTVNTPDQYLMSIINTLSPEEQMRQAITVLLFEKIDLPGISTSTNYVTEQVNQMLASQLNALTKTTIKGIDISFGIDSYTAATSSGGEQTKTSLSYDVRKSLLNDRAQIEISGRINDYANQQSSSNMSLNNFSFEYRLDSAATKFVKVYNEHTYEDVFEGEVVKTGVGFIYRKSYKSLRDIWKRDERKKKTEKEEGR